MRQNHRFSLSRHGGTAVSLLIIIVWLVSLIFCLLRAPISLTNLRTLDAFLFFWMQFLFVGLFIISHDACHGSIAPQSPKVNLWLGRVSAFLYAGFSFDKIQTKHIDHHRYSGTRRDPDFLVVPTGRAERSGPYLKWLLSFFSRYVSVPQILLMTAVSQILIHGFSLPESNVFFFWVAPSVLSALQLFTFGTYLPHRGHASEFSSRHRARNSKQRFWRSLLTCYHFGAYHLIHHQEPSVPWYKLPARTWRETNKPKSS